MNIKKIIWFVLIIIILVGLIWWSQSRNKVPSEESIKIGALLILSGDYGQYGESSQKAIKIAIDEYNNDPKNTKKAEIIYEDTKGDPKTAVSAYKKLTSLDKVDVILGPLLQVEMAAIGPLVKQDNIPVFSVAPIPLDQRGTTANPLVIWPDPTLEAEQMAQYTYDQGARKIGILNTRDAWESEVSEAFSKKFIALGGTVTSHEIVLPDSDDTSLTVTKVMATKPDSVFIGTYYKFVYFVKKLGELGFKGRLYSVEIDSSLADLAKPYSNGLQFISPVFYTPEFRKKYVDLYGVEPSIPVGQAYDAANILLSIMKDAESSAEARSKMEKLREFDGASGKIEFSEDHRTTFQVNIFEVKNGLMDNIQ